MTIGVLAMLAGLLGGAWAGDPFPAEDAEPLTYASRTVDGRHLLADDPSGTGRVVEVLGDLHTAEDIAVVVPGVGQTRANFRTASNGHPGTVPMANGRALYEEMRAQRPDRDIAVVVWLGYEPPTTVDLDAITTNRAERGADELVRFTDRLPDRAHVTLACHSYGSTVCGKAASRRAGVADDVVALASPGMGVSNARDVHARVWATTASDDWIRLVPSLRVGTLGLGGDPANPSFGARWFPPGRISGHEQYYRPGSLALRSTARIALGDGGEVTQL